jgi:cytochrome c oxidase assembly protein subunit 15
MATRSSSGLSGRLSRENYTRICAGALAALCMIVVTGALVRLTGSGLGCSDWPTCEHNQFVAAANFHPMVEFINRLITGIVSLAVCAAVLGSFAVTPRRKDLTRWSVALVVGVVAQIVIGAFVTLSELAYSTVALHFLVSMVLVWAAVVLVERSRLVDEFAPRQPWPRWAVAAFVLGGLVLVTGSVVTSAGPHAGDPDVKRLPMDFGRVARVHSVTVWLLVALIFWIVWQHRHSSGPLRRRSNDLLLGAVAQGGIGYLQYFTHVPAGLVATHVAGATLVWVLLCRLVLATRWDNTVGPDVSDSTDAAAVRTQ